MEIKASDVKALREKTGCGLMDCKKALTDANGDMAEAARILKESGLAAMEKRSERASTEASGEGAFETSEEDATGASEE